MSEVLSPEAVRAARLNFSRLPKELIARNAAWHPGIEPFDLQSGPKSGVRVGYVGSEYLRRGLDLECELFLLTPGNWRLFIDNAALDFLLVESCFDSATGFWGNAQASFSERLHELQSVAAHCSRRGVPTIFWITQSFEYAEYYLTFSKSVDKVFCADGRVAGWLKQRGVKAEWLPQGVQTAIYHPFTKVGEKIPGFGARTVIYDGIVDVLKSEALHQKLHGLQECDLKIIESNNLVFKKKLSDLGRLAGNALGCVTASGRASVLRFARAEIFTVDALKSAMTQQRMVLEALASRTVVVHDGRLGDDDLRKELVVEVGRGLHHHGLNEILPALLGDRVYLEALAQAAWRTVNLEHSLSNRMQVLCRAVDVSHEWVRYPRVTVVTPTIRPEFYRKAIEQFDAQAYPDKELVLAVNSAHELPEWLRLLPKSRLDIKVVRVPPERFTGFSLKMGFEAASGELVFKMDDDDWYGNNYLLDLVIAQRSTNADLFGKPPTYVHFEDSGGLYERKFNSHPFQLLPIRDMKPNISWIGGNTLAGKTSLLRNTDIHDNCYGAADTALMFAVKRKASMLGIYDGLNAVAIRFADTSRHTWQVASRAIKNNSKKVSSDFDKVKSIWNMSLKGLLETWDRVEVSVNGNMDARIVAGIASIPEREFQLAMTLKSVINQVDHVHVYLNGYASVPDYLEHEKISVHRSQEHGDLGAAGKLFAIEQVSDGYYFCLDDDIIYPSDYVEKMVAVLRKYGNQVVTTVHGSIFGEPLEWYFERTAVYEMQHGLNSDRFVSLLGTGCCAFFRPALDLRFSDFYPDVMCDLTLSIKAREQGMPIVAVKRESMWLKQQQVNRDSSYFHKMMIDDGGRTKRAQEYRWAVAEFKKIVAALKDEVMPQLTLDEARRLDMDSEFLATLTTDETPRAWDPNCSTVFLRRKYQYLRTIAARRKGLQCDPLAHKTGIRSAYLLKLMINRIRKVVGQPV